MSIEGRVGRLGAEIAAISRIAAIPAILEVICRATGMGFAAIAYVTEDRWIACSVKDEIGFGLQPGDELKVETTICHEIRQTLNPVVIDNVDGDDCYRGHPTPQIYGFKSYISYPISLPDGTFFGTLCAIDPKTGPAGEHRCRRHVQAVRRTDRLPYRRQRTCRLQRGTLAG